ncbi:hypothetical protein JMA_01850 [Jeotgalibacillus malaysiensis]|uniref:Uncharacterized protein n=1 Tax=Jeotgalibacillus malaysiensis TaxID=1508404 RepID=A0A0B5ALB3_9BACL|nr:hypothetical protein [Jeotgalibacillus malaysiensis]AJD89502.1 hypothetical protein JMA_01850 [Jeotgalibacillus malaysiensis]
MKSIMKKLPPIIIILFLVAQSFLFSYTYAVTPWSGNTWEGNTWQGNTWDGHTWEGSIFEGGTFQGNSFSGNGIQGNPGTIEGVQWQGPPWSIQPWAGVILTPPPSFNGNPILVPGMTPDGPIDGTAGSMPGPINGAPGTAPGGPMNGAPSINPGDQVAGGPGQSPAYPFNPNTGQSGPLAPGAPNGSVAGGNGQASGVPYINQNSYGAGYQGPLLEKMGLAGYPITTNEESGYNFNGYDVTKFLVHDMGRAHLDLIDDSIRLGDDFGYGNTFDLRKAALLGGLKVGFKDNSLVDFVDTVDTGASMYTNGKMGYDALRSGGTLVDLGRGGTSAALTAGSTGSALGGASNAASSIGAVSRLGAVSAGIGVGFGIYETATKGIDFINMDSSTPTNERVAQGADTMASLGETLVNGGLLASAFPGTQAAAPFLLVGGAAIWGVAKGTKLIAENWDSIKKFGKSVGDGAKKAYNSVKDAVGGGLDTVAGWFGK